MTDEDQILDADQLEEATRLCYAADRETVVKILEGVLCIACYDEENTGELRTALLENVKDGTMSLEDLRLHLSDQ